jgi:hypothetical protein
VSDLIQRLEAARTDHLRLATWNTSKDRPARVAFHIDTSLAIRDAISRLRSSPDNQTLPENG